MAAVRFRVCLGGGSRWGAAAGVLRARRLGGGLTGLGWLWSLFADLYLDRRRESAATRLLRGHHVEQPVLLVAAALGRLTIAGGDPSAVGQ